MSEHAADPLDDILRVRRERTDTELWATTLFDRLADTATCAVIFGAGALGRLVLAAARDNGLEIVAFADNDPALWGQEQDGLPVLSPADAMRQHEKNAAFIVAIYNGAAPRRQLHALGCPRIIPYAAFAWRYQSRSRNSPFELPHHILAAEHQIRAGYSCLSDARSRDEFAAQISWRTSLDDNQLAPADPASDIYFPRDLFHLSEDETFVDCGAFDGDSIRLFLDKANGKFRHIYAYEPDRGNRQALAGYLSTLDASERDTVSLLPFAIGSRDETVSFHAMGTAGSHMTLEQGLDSIDCRRLDTLLASVTPTFIKMDIEGAEPEALRGATNVIRRSRPILAICAYHTCEHLWTLPTMITAALPEYQIFLRRYAEECWEMVYYAVPPERVTSTP